MNKAIFLDRDGVIDELVYYESSGEYEAPRTADRVRILPGVAFSLRRAREAGWLLFIVTNQPSYAKGKISRESLVSVHRRILEDLEAEGVMIDASYECFHHPQAVVEELRVACECRKPNPGQVIKAAREFDVDLAASWFVGDQETDVQCGRNAGCRVALIEYAASADKRGTIPADMRCSDLPEFVERLLAV